jgi:hypothetical protein
MAIDDVVKDCGNLVNLENAERGINSKELEKKYDALSFLGKYIEGNRHFYAKEPELAASALYNGSKDKGVKGLRQLKKEGVEYVEGNLANIVNEIPNEQLIQILASLPRSKDDNYKDVTHMLDIVKTFQESIQSTTARRQLLARYSEEQQDEYENCKAFAGKDSTIDDEYSRSIGKLSAYCKKKMKEIGEGKIKEYAVDRLDAIPKDMKEPIYLGLYKQDVLSKKN